MTGDHALFTQLDLIEWDVLTPDEKVQFQTLRTTIDALRTENTPESITYAIFLLVLTAIFRERMAEIPQLYDLAEIQASLRQDFRPDDAPAVLRILTI